MEGLMQDDSTVWNAIFAREGIVFSHPHDDVRHLADISLIAALKRSSILAAEPVGTSSILEGVGSRCMG
jgi:hypothetical protein